MPRITSIARSLSAPTTTLSGRMKSSTADPSRRNSGLLTTSNSMGSAWFSSTILLSLLAVPTGTVLFWTMTR